MFLFETILESHSCSFKGLRTLDGELACLLRGCAAEARGASVPRALRIYLNSLSTVQVGGRRVPGGFFLRSS